MKYALGIFVLLPGLLLLPWIFGEWNSIVNVIHAPTMFAFIYVIAGVLFVTREFKTFIKAVNALFSKKYKISAEDREKGIKLFAFLSKAVIYTAVIHTVWGVIWLLGDINDQQYWGPALSVTLITVLYAAMLNLVFIHPAIHILKTRQAEEKPAVINERQVINKMLELCYKNNISPEEIINADEIIFRNSNG